MHTGIACADLNSLTAPSAQNVCEYSSLGLAACYPHALRKKDIGSGIESQPGPREATQRMLGAIEPYLQDKSICTPCRGRTLTESTMNAPRTVQLILTAKSILKQGGD